MKIISLGLPKCGSVSLTACLNSAGIPAVHWWTDDRRHAGLEILRAVQEGKPFFEYLKSFEAVTQMDLVSPPEICFFPQISLFESIYRAYPEALYLLPTRNLNDHIESLKSWNGGDFARRLSTFGITNLAEWILRHYDHVTEFFAWEKFIFRKLNFFTFDIATVTDEDLSSMIGRPVHFPHLNKTSDHAFTDAQS